MVIGMEPDRASSWRALSELIWEFARFEDRVESRYCKQCLEGLAAERGCSQKVSGGLEWEYQHVAYEAALC